MIFYSILFALDKSKQEYARCFWLLLTSLVRSGSLKEGDRYYLIADDASWAAASKLPLVTQKVCRIPTPTPADCFDGMKLKYLLPRSLLSQEDVVVYLDVDLLAVRPFRPELPPDTLVAAPEGNPQDANYKGDFHITLPVGASAGIFVFRPGPVVYAVFDAILAEMARDRRPFYTLDQPYYNKHINGIAKYMRAELISYNGHTNRDKCAFLNLCGEPGDGDFHFSKMLQCFLQLF